MSNDRKRFLKQFAHGSTSKSLQVHRGGDTGKPASVVSAAVVGAAVVSERSRYLASLAKSKAVKTTAKESTNTVVHSASASSYDPAVLIKFDLTSLQAFCARASLTAGSVESSRKTARKRPGYDNRLRRMNAKVIMRIMHLS